jgi:hypothetical protein
MSYKLSNTVMKIFLNAFAKQKSYGFVFLNHCLIKEGSGAVKREDVGLCMSGSLGTEASPPCKWLGRPWLDPNL